MSHKSFLLSTLLILALSLTGCFEDNEKPAQKKQPQPPQVIVSKPLIKEVIEWDEYTGRFDAVERVDISARVNGYLDEIKFTDGDYVEKGDVLFVIDQRPFKIALDRAQAQFELAQKELDRAKRLRESAAISQEQLDRRIQEYRLAKAAVDEVELDLEFSEVKSPISGKIGEARVDVGNLVNGGQQNPTILTTVVSIDPIHFYFDVNESDHLKYLRLDRKGVRPGSDRTANPIFARLPDEDDFIHRGQMDFVDNVVDEGTGTVEARAVFPNVEGLIYPGLFARVRVIGSEKYKAFLVPDDAISSDQNKKMVMTVNKNNKVSPKFVELGPIRESGLRIIKSGLSKNDKIIIKGLMKARPGSKVSPKNDQISEEQDPKDRIMSPKSFRPEHMNNGDASNLKKPFKTGE